MKVVIINTHDLDGGAARAAYRLHRGLLSFDIDSQMLVQIKTGGDFKVIGPSSLKSKLYAKVRPFLDKLTLRKYSNKTQALFSRGVTGDRSLISKINALEPDIVHLHWINEGFLSVNDISAIKAPIVWSLHDMWPFTGGCHYDEWCGAYETGCGTCKVLSSQNVNDISRKMIRYKKLAYDNSNITVIGLSHWLAREASKSLVFKGKKIVNLPNPIDPKEFGLVNKTFARELFNLPLDKKLILFGAMRATGAQRKGFTQLAQALLKLDVNFDIVVFGAELPEEPDEFIQKCHYMGTLKDNASLKALYNAADVMVVPSLQENLSNAIMESLVCGTPVAAFDIGGNGDMIKHQQNGYLAKPFCSEDLAYGIDWLIKHFNSEASLQSISEKALNSYSTNNVIPQYIQLYQSIMEIKKRE